MPYLRVHPSASYKCTKRKPIFPQPPLPFFQISFILSHSPSPSRLFPDSSWTLSRHFLDSFPTLSPTLSRLFSVSLRLSPDSFPTSPILPAPKPSFRLFYLYRRMPWYYSFLFRYLSLLTKSIYLLCIYTSFHPPAIFFGTDSIRKLGSDGFDQGCNGNVRTGCWPSSFSPSGPIHRPYADLAWKSDSCL